MALFDLDEHWLPSIVPTTYAYGQIQLNQQPVALQLLGGDQNFIPCAYDESMAPASRSAWVNLGTGGFVQSLLPQHVHPDDLQGLLRTHVSLETDRPSIAVAEGTINAAATALDAWQQHCLAQHWRSTPYSTHQLEQLLQHSGEAPIFCNTLAGTGSPFWLDSAPPHFIDLRSGCTDSVALKTLAVLESIVFACQDNLSILQQLNPKLEQIIISGGLSQLHGLCQHLADITGLPVARYSNHDASARGCARYLLQATAGAQPAQDDANLPLECYRPRQAAAMQQRYQHYRQWIEA